MQITIHRGTREVGGNCVELQSGKSRIVLDVGMPLFDSKRQTLDTGDLRRRPREELLAQGILPRVPGLFVEGPRVDAILLSHAHEDHTGLIPHSFDDIPVYASTGTSKMMLAGHFFAMQPDLPDARFHKLTAGQPVTIGAFRVTPFEVDHSIFGAMAFLIEADGQKVLYSGDLRLHGRHPKMAEALISELAGITLNAVLIEGTHIEHPDLLGPTEHTLEDHLVQWIEDAPSLVLASFSPQHVDRLIAFLNAAQRTGRLFAADGYTAFVIYLVQSQIPELRKLADEVLRVWYPTYYRGNRHRPSLANMEKAFASRCIELDQLRENPARYVTIFRPSMFTSDFEDKLPSESLCLHSRWAGYLEQPEWKSLALALDGVCGRLQQVHTSGHIFAADIARFLSQLEFRQAIPIHTFDPEGFQIRWPNVVCLKDGEAFQIERDGASHRCRGVDPPCEEPAASAVPLTHPETN